MIIMMHDEINEILILMARFFNSQAVGISGYF